MGIPSNCWQRSLNGAKALNEAKFWVNGEEVTPTFDDQGVATIECAQGDVVEIDFTENPTTGIAAAATQNGKVAPIYDLSGRRVAGTAKKGVYIRNGKKYIVK